MVIEHIAGDLTCTVEAPTPLAELQQTLGREGQMLALDPPDDGGLTVGETFDRALFGPRAHRYGLPRDLILGVRVRLPDGTVARDKIWEYCQNYEKRIKDAGGLDFQLLGIGRTGHVGFNEPGSSRDSKTRLITLDSVTRRDAASDFFGEENVPRKAITMGVGSIMDARRVIMMAWGEGWPSRSHCIAREAQSLARR